MSNMVNMTNLEKGKRSVFGLRELRFVVMLTEDENAQIQEYRFTNRIGTKADAVRELIRRGLEKKEATTGGKFGDLAPADAATSNRQETIDAEHT